jgi:hypothetical protein
VAALVAVALEAAVVLADVQRPEPGTVGVDAALPAAAAAPDVPVTAAPAAVPPAVVPSSPPAHGVVLAHGEAEGGEEPAGSTGKHDSPGTSRRQRARQPIEAFGIHRAIPKPVTCGRRRHRHERLRTGWHVGTPPVTSCYWFRLTSL